MSPHRRAARCQIGRQRLNALAGPGADGVDAGTRGDGLGLPDGEPGVGHQVGLGEHHHRLGTRLPGEGQVALKARQVEVVIEGLQNEDGLEVGGHRLLSPALVRVTASENRAPGQRIRNLAVAALTVPQGDKVAHRGEELTLPIVIGPRLKAGRAKAVLAHQLIPAAMGGQHPGHDALGQVFFQISCKAVVLYIHCIFKLLGLILGAKIPHTDSLPEGCKLRLRTKKTRRMKVRY